MAGPLRYGMVGGGEGAFIRRRPPAAIRARGSATLVAGCFSGVTRTRSAPGRALGLDASRLYRSFEEMAEAEAARRTGSTSR